MNTITFDTLKFVDRLIESGMPEKQAKALAEAQAEISETHLGDLVTKGDLRETKGEMREMELRLNAQLTIIKWMLALVIITTVVPALKSLFT